MKIFAWLVLGLGVLACTPRSAAPHPRLVGSFACGADSTDADGAVRALLITHDATQPMRIAIAVSPTPDTTGTWSFALEGIGSVANSTAGSRAQCDLRGAGLGPTLSLRASSNKPIMVSLITLDATVRSSTTVKPRATGSLSFDH